MNSKKAFWLLLCICVLTVFPFLGLSEYNTKGEPRESIVSYTMIESGNWILPRNSVGEMAYKPPFFYWCIAAVSVVYGEVTEFTSRVPSAVAYIVLTLATFLFYQRRRDALTGLVAALVAFTSWEMHRQGGNCRVDMVLTLFIVTAMLLLYRWWERGMKGVPWVALLMMSLGTLTKGPVAVILPCLVTGVFLLCRRVNFFRAFFTLCAFGLLALVLPALWYYAAWRQGGQEFVDLMLEENWGRMTQTMTYESNVHPWYYYFMALPGGYLPWTLLGVMTLFVVDWKGLRQKWLGRKGAWHRLAPSAFDPLDLFSFLAVAVVFLFYCFPQSKRGVYIMPIYPFLGYFFARMLCWLQQSHRRVLSVFGGFLSVVELLVALLFVALKFVPVSTNWFHGRHAFEHLMMVQGLQQTGSWWLWGVWMLGVVVMIWWWKSSRGVLPLLALILAIYLHVDAVYKPPVLNAKSQKGVAAAINELFPESEGHLYEFVELGVLAKGDPVHFFELNFYLHDRVGDFWRQRPQSGILMIGADDLQGWRTKFENEGYRFTPLWNSGEKRVMKQQLLLLRFEKASEI